MLGYRATLSFLENKKREKEKSIIFFSGLAGSLRFFHWLVDISFALSVRFSFFPLLFRVRACTRNTASWASPASLRVSAGLAGRGGVARSAVAVFVASRRVCLETREKHEWALSVLHL